MSGMPRSSRTDVGQPLEVAHGVVAEQADQGLGLGQVRDGAAASAARRVACRSASNGASAVRAPAWSARARACGPPSRRTPAPAVTLTTPRRARRRKTGSQAR